MNASLAKRGCCMFALLAVLGAASVVNAQSADEYVRPGTHARMQDVLSDGASQFHSPPVDVDCDGDGRMDAMLEIDLDALDGRTGLVLARHSARGWSGTLIAAVEDTNHEVAWNPPVSVAGRVYLVSMLATHPDNGRSVNEYRLWSAGPNEVSAVFTDRTRDGEDTWLFEPAADGASIVVSSTRRRYRVLNLDVLSGQWTGLIWGMQRPAVLAPRQ